MVAEIVTPFDLRQPGQSRIERLAASVRCARAAPFYQRTLPDIEINAVEDLRALPFSSRVKLSMAEHLGEVIIDPRKIFRSVYPFHQNAGTFPFQVVAGERDLYRRHDRMVEMFKATGLAQGSKLLILTGPAQFFFASDFCGEFLFEKHHICLQNIVHFEGEALRRRIEVFKPEVLVLATDSRSVTPAVIPDTIKAIITFRGAYPEVAELEDVTVVDVYTLTEAPYLAYRKRGERFYRFDPDVFHIESSPSGLLTVTTLIWEVMPLIRYQTYDHCGEVDNDRGLVEVLSFREW